MAHGFFQDDAGNKSSSRLLCFMVVLALIAMAGCEVYHGKGIPELHWTWVALPIGMYLIGKVGVATAEGLMSIIVGRIVGPKP